MYINDVLIEDTFAEAFPMWFSRLLITADSRKQARLAAETAAGLSTSIIGCGCEAGCGEDIPPEETPDGRPGVILLLFSYSPEKLEEHLLLRIGQAVLPTASSACFNALEGCEKRNIGGKLRYFGDGYQSSKLLDGRRFWRIPVADGEFVVDESFDMQQGVGGGNIIIIGGPRQPLYNAAEAALEAILEIPGIIAPFPGGICRSPSKPGSRYAGVIASTNHPYCPTLRSRCETLLPQSAEAAYEIVIDGIDEAQVARAMSCGIQQACRPSVQCISAGNYGGNLGPYHFHLQQLLEKGTSCD